MIAAVALIVRMAAILATPDHNLVSDPADYARHALSIVHDRDYPNSLVTDGPTAIRPPGFPLLLAGVFAVSGDSVGAARAVQALLGVVVVLLIALITREIWGERTALVAGGLAAVFPPFIVVGATLFSEPLFVALLLAAVLAALRWRARPARRLIVAGGLLVGLAILTRANGAVILIPLLFAFWQPHAWRERSAYMAPALFLACAAVVIAPWTVRNAITMDAFVPVSDQDGYTLVGTYNDTARDLGGAWVPASLDERLRRFIEQRRHWNEVKLGSALRSEARQYALDHPGYVLTVAKHNTLQLFSLSWEDEKIGQRVGAGLGKNWAALTALGFYPFLALALLGLLVRAWRPAPVWFWAIPVLLLSVIMVAASSRFRAPIDPFLLMLAAGASVWLFDRLRPVRNLEER